MLRTGPSAWRPELDGRRTIVLSPTLALGLHAYPRKEKTGTSEYFWVPQQGSHRTAGPEGRQVACGLWITRLRPRSSLWMGTFYHPRCLWMGTFYHPHNIVLSPTRASLHHPRESRFFSIRTTTCKTLTRARVFNVLTFNTFNSPRVRLTGVGESQIGSLPG